MIPEGDLLRSRVLTALAPALSAVLERRLDGYALVASRDGLLGSDSERGVVTFEDGVPVLAYHSRTDRGGPQALDDIGAAPYRFDLYALDPDALELPHRNEDLRVGPGTVAERLAGDPALADRTRERAGTLDRDPDDGLEAFLDDEAAIEGIKRSAREEATEKADAWGIEEAIEER
ncbi:hypothetical protein [Natronomonas sp.]|uniref:hypothetical protein n=1 Tax=Natronomonas sp. TaxID=2184060 RepID=UPI002610D0EE|nr:hypothetical protein [Natronomonas sp.]